MTWKPLSFGLCKKRANNEIRGGNSNYRFFTNWKEGYYRVAKTLWVTLYRCKNRLWVSKYKSWKGHGKKVMVCWCVCDSVTWGHLGWGMKSVRGSVMGFCLELLLWIWIRFGLLWWTPRGPSWCSIIQKVFMDTHPFVHFHFDIDFAHCIDMNF